MNDKKQLLSGKASYPAESVLSELKAGLRSGKWKPGEKFPSEVSLAENYGICRSTMNKILKSIERDGLLYGGPGRGRFVSEYSNRSTKLIDVVLSDDDSIPRFIPLLDAIKQDLTKVGFHMRISSLNEKWGAYEIGKTEEYLNLINPDSIDGCIIVTQAIQLETALALAFRKPVVWFHHPSIRPGLAGVRFDFAGGSFRAVRHLSDLGHKEIGFAGVHERFVSGREQATGIKLAVESLKNTAPVNVRMAIGNDWSTEEGYRITKELLSSGNRPTAIIYALDPYLLGGLKAFKELGVSIPDEVSVVGWNDSISEDVASISLTSIKMDLVDAAKKAVAQIFSQIEFPEMEIPTAEVPIELIVRSSTGKPRA